MSLHLRSFRERLQDVCEASDAAMAVIDSLIPGEGAPKHRLKAYVLPFFDTVSATTASQLLPRVIALGQRMDLPSDDPAYRLACACLLLAHTPIAPKSGVVRRAPDRVRHIDRLMARIRKAEAMNGVELRTVIQDWEPEAMCIAGFRRWASPHMDADGIPDDDSDRYPWLVPWT